MEMLDQWRADGHLESSVMSLEEACEQMPSTEVIVYDSYCAIECFKSKLISHAFIFTLKSTSWSDESN